MPDTRSRTVQSVDRAVRLLRVIAESDTDLSLAELANRCSLERPTAWRLLWTLEANDMVEKAGPSRYRLSPRVPGLTPHHLQDSLVRLSRPVLTELAATHRVTASLAYLQPFDLAYVDQVDGPSFTAPHWEGPLSLHASSPGKAVLAALPDSEARAMVGSHLAKLTETTITDDDEFTDELARVRALGYATCHGEDVTYSNGASAAIQMNERPIAAIDLWGPDRRVPESRLDELGQAAIHAAAKIESLLRPKQQPDQDLGANQ